MVLSYVDQDLQAKWIYSWSLFHPPTAQNLGAVPWRRFPASNPIWPRLLQDLQAAFPPGKTPEHQEISNGRTDWTDPEKTSVFNLVALHIATYLLMNRVRWDSVKIFGWTVDRQNGSWKKLRRQPCFHCWKPVNSSFSSIRYNSKHLFILNPYSNYMLLMPCFLFSSQFLN